jgi:hypothetical protein
LINSQNKINDKPDKDDNSSTNNISPERNESKKKFVKSNSTISDKSKQNIDKDDNSSTNNISQERNEGKQKLVKSNTTISYKSKQNEKWKKNLERSKTSITDDLEPKFM